MSAAASTAAESSPHPSSDVSLLPPCRHIRINLGDPAIVKHTLDEQAAMFVLDAGYVEDVTLSNLKLGFGVFAVLLTILTHVYPLLLPSSSSAGFIKACVLIFFTVQGALQLLHMLVEKDCILLTKQKIDEAATSGAPEESKKKDSGKGKKKNVVVAAPVVVAPAASSSLPTLPPFAVSLQASLPRYETTYQLTLATRTSESVFASLRGSSSSAGKDALSSPSSSSSSAAGVSADGIPNVSVSVALQITDYFDVNGVMLLEEYHASLRQLVQAYAEEVHRVQKEAGSNSSSSSRSNKKKQ